MLAAILLNLDRPGGVPKDTAEDRANRAIPGLRREAFAAQEALKQDMEAAKVIASATIPEIIKLDLPGVTASPDKDRVGTDDELALLFILAEL